MRLSQEIYFRIDRRKTMTAGNCGKCSSENIDYGAIDNRDGLAFYPYECSDCGHTGAEWYELNYIGTDENEG